jgi:cation diffusion facilitator family transporter
VDAVPRAVRATQLAMLVNAALASVKLVAGLLGHSYALVADAVESAADLLASSIVWGGLRIASRDPDERYPFGYGKAEPLAAAIVALLLFGAAVAIAVEAIAEIRTPHHAPAWWTLLVLVLVVVVKGVLSRRVQAVGRDIGSTAVQADAVHHLSDALTSGAAFIGISVALIGGPGWESADDWAALIAAAVILFTATRILRPALDDLMDRSAEPAIVDAIQRAALGVPGVRHTEKLAVRRSGLTCRVTLHVQSDPAMTLHDAHVVSGMVKSAIRLAVPRVQSVLVHMEPYEDVDSPVATRTDSGGG